jgi:hypothetical protein
VSAAIVVACIATVVAASVTMPEPGSSFRRHCVPAGSYIVYSAAVRPAAFANSSIRLPETSLRKPIAAPSRSTYPLGPPSEEYGGIEYGGLPVAAPPSPRT